MADRGDRRCSWSARRHYDGRSLQDAAFIVLRRTGHPHVINVASTAHKSAIDARIELAFHAFGGNARKPEPKYGCNHSMANHNVNAATSRHRPISLEMNR